MQQLIYKMCHEGISFDEYGEVRKYCRENNCLDILDKYIRRFCFAINIKDETFYVPTDKASDFVHEINSKNPSYVPANKK